MNKKNFIKKLKNISVLSFLLVLACVMFVACNGGGNQNEISDVTELKAVAIEHETKF